MTSYLVKPVLLRETRRPDLVQYINMRAEGQLVSLYKLNWRINAKMKEQSFESKENGNPRENLYKLATNKYRQKVRIMFFIVIIMKFYSSLLI